MDSIILKPIGVIRTPFNKIENIPIQGTLGNDTDGYVELENKYTDGLIDLDKFSHAILIYYFHRSSREDIVGSPFLEDTEHGIFAIRSPHRPNHLGMTIVKIKKIKVNRLYFTGADMLDQTPLLDIKPYIKYFDQRDNVVSGWIESHFKDDNSVNNKYTKS
jgi:tRNA-Thr(GGU) m(6)t(6)A37 methyltransferase TsaA